MQKLGEEQEMPVELLKPVGLVDDHDPAVKANAPPSELSATHVVGVAQEIPTRNPAGESIPGALTHVELEGLDQV